MRARAGGFQGEAATHLRMEIRWICLGGISKLSKLSGKAEQSSVSWGLVGGAHLRLWDHAGDVGGGLV